MQKELQDEILSLKGKLSEMTIKATNAQEKYTKSLRDNQKLRL